MFRQQTNLTSDVALVGKYTDPNLQNPWGVVNKDKSTFWIADNDANVISQYDKSGKWTGVLPITVTGGKPTGLVKNTDSTLFQAATLIVVTQNGTIEAWNTNTGTSTQIVYQLNNTVYTGVDILKGQLYVANFSRGTVDIFDTNFNYVDSFSDAELVDTTYAPYNVYSQSGKLYVAFAKQNAMKTDVLNGEGNGYIDVFDPNGVLLKRLVNRGHLNSPWGMTAVEMEYRGSKTKLLLVGNAGSGTIAIYDRKCGDLLQTMKDDNKNCILIDSLKGLLILDLSENCPPPPCPPPPCPPRPVCNTRGGRRVQAVQARCVNPNPVNCNNNCDKNRISTSIYFTAGINDQANGLFGVLKRTSNKC